MYRQINKKHLVLRPVVQMQHWHLVGLQQIIFILIHSGLHGALLLHPAAMGRTSGVRFPLGNRVLAMVSDILKSDSVDSKPGVAQVRVH